MEGLCFVFLFLKRFWPELMYYAAGGQKKQFTEMNRYKKLTLPHEVETAGTPETPRKWYLVLHCSDPTSCKATPEHETKHENPLCDLNTSGGWRLDTAEAYHQ